MKTRRIEQEQFILLICYTQKKFLLPNEDLFDFK